MKLSDYQSDVTTRVAVSGLSGSGKTSLVAALAEKYRLKWIDLENSLGILKKLPAAWQDNIDYLQIPDSAHYPIAAETMLILFKTGRANICYQHGKIQCAVCRKNNLPFMEVDFNSLTPHDIVVVDSGSQISNSLLAHITKDKDVTYKPLLDDWGALKKYCEYFKSQWQAARFNLVIIFHTLEASLEDNKKKLVPLFGSRDMSASIGGAFQHVIYCEVLNKSHRAASSSTHSNSVLTKSRDDFVIEKLDKPSLIPLFDLYSSGQIAEAHRQIVSEPVAISLQKTAHQTLGEQAQSSLSDRLKQLKGVK